MTSIISVGFSCQTRYSIDTLFSDSRRHPFDFNISTRDAVIEGIRTSGSNFGHSDQASIYTMPISRYQGVYNRGLFFWHDYPLNENRELDGLWKNKISDVEKKYSFLWSRFMSVLRDKHHKKILVCSNTQINLTEFAAEDDEFNKNFGLDGVFAGMLSENLSLSGAQNFSLLFVNRNISHSHDISCRNFDFELKNRFWGSVNLRTNTKLAAATLIDRLTTIESRLSLEKIVGYWGRGQEIKILNDRVAYVYRIDKERARVPWGEICPIEDGYLFTFDGTDTRHYTAILENGNLEFSNRASWRRLG